MEVSPTGFSTFGLDDRLLRAVQEMGFESPTPIQQETIPKLLAGDVDFIGLAQTGTGKTAAYGLPLLAKIDFTRAQTQALILCPTRELCLQVMEEIQKMGRYLERLTTIAVYGGAEFDKQARALKKGAQVVVATPGRMLDQIRRQNANLSAVQVVVLDEADKMLEMGFQEDVEEIMQQAAGEKKIWLFSATMPSEIRRLAQTYMNSPQEAGRETKSRAAENVRHLYYLCPHGAKIDALRRLLDYNPDIYGLIFTRTKIEAQEVAEELTKHKYNADALHGDLPQAQRDRVMKMFRQGTLRILVATDVAARGLDVQNLTHVLHMDLPDERETYVHRAGRTARAGKHGISAALVTSGQLKRLYDVERLIGVKFEKTLIPTPQGVVLRRFENYVDNLTKLTFDLDAVNGYLETLHEKLVDLDKEELLRRVCAWELNRFMELYGVAPDLNPPERDRDRRNGREVEKGGGGSPSEKYARFFINLGEKDGFSKMSLLRYLSQLTGLPPSHLNRIQVLDTYSFFESFKDEEVQVLKRAQNVAYGDRKIVIETAVERDAMARRDKPAPRGGYDRKPAERSESRYTERYDSYNSGAPKAKSGGYKSRSAVDSRPAKNRPTGPKKRGKYVSFFEEEI